MVSEAPADSRCASLLMILNCFSLGYWSISYAPPIFSERSEFKVVPGVEVCVRKFIAFHSESFRRETNLDDTALLFCTQTAHRSLHILPSPLPACQEGGWWVSAFGLTAGGLRDVYFSQSLALKACDLKEALHLSCLLASVSVA